MYKKTLVFSTILLSGCTTLSADDDFSDAIRSVDKRADYVAIEAKSITPKENKGYGANAIKNISQVVANYPLTAALNVPESYVAVELNYMKAHSEYSSVMLNGKALDIKPYAPSDETCSEHCTITQYITFPIDNDLIEKSAQNGLTYLLKTENDMSQLSFSIPAGYFQAILNEYKTESAVVSPVAPAPQPLLVAVALQSQSIEMTQYWYSEATLSEQEQFTQWAVANRKSIDNPLVSESKALDMMSYWYEKSSKEEKSQILMWLLSQ
ncbi:hypothetical protein [Vibrio alfacsensis]|uniref:hypothetical protein n=1 Tax=Vibrio TaxID=662 RepID=UPI0040680332